MKTLILINSCQAEYKEILEVITQKYEWLDYEVIKEEVLVDKEQNRMSISYSIWAEIIKDYKNVVILWMNSIQDKRREKLRWHLQRKDVKRIDACISTVFWRFFLIEWNWVNFLFWNSLIKYQKDLWEDCADTLELMLLRLLNWDFSSVSKYDTAFKEKY